MNNYDLLKSIFVEMFDVDESSDFSNLSQETLKNWDSMMQVNLIVAIESELEFLLTPKIMKCLHLLKIF